MGKWEQFGTAAEELYVKQGKSLREIAELLQIAPKTIGEWSKKHNWVAKRKTAKTSPVEIARLAEDVLRAKLEELRELPPEDIDPAKIDAMYKLLLTVEKTSKETRLLEKGIFVMNVYVDYLRRTVSPEDIEIEFQRVNGFLTSLEEQGA